MKIAYADPPYPRLAKYYRDHPDYDGEVDHAALIARLEAEFDGWVLHTYSNAIPLLAPLVPCTARWLAWVKPFASFKPGVAPAYAWEPVIIKAARKPSISERLILRDWIACSITLRRGLVGAKPEAVCHWAFECVGAARGDEFHDLFPGSGAVTRAWDSWRPQFEIAV
jgi:hypothetical protein